MQEQLTFLDIVKMCFHLAWGGYWIFQGLNGFFKWKKVPSVSEEMDHFLEHFQSTKGLMESVKLLEIVGGMMIFFQQNLVITWYLFLPLIWGIIILHWNYNPKPKPLLLMISIPWMIFTQFTFQ